MESTIEQGEGVPGDDIESAERLSRLLEQDYRRYPRLLGEEYR